MSAAAIDRYVEERTRPLRRATDRDVREINELVIENRRRVTRSLDGYGPAWVWHVLPWVLVIGGSFLLGYLFGNQIGG